MSTQRNTRGSVTKLYIWGEDLDPELISQYLKMKPFKAWRKGQPKIVTTPTGAVKVLSTPQKLGCWCVRIPESAVSKSLPEQLQYWNILLKRHEAIFCEFNRRKFDFYIDCFVNEGPTVSFDLAADLLESLGKLGLGIKVSFYDSNALFDD